MGESIRFFIAPSDDVFFLYASTRVEQTFDETLMGIILGSRSRIFC